MFPLWTAFLVAIALVAGGVWVYRRYFRKVSGREDRYTPERILTPEQVAMLDYLRDTFPDQCYGQYPHVAAITPYSLAEPAIQRLRASACGYTLGHRPLVNACCAEHTGGGLTDQQFRR